MSSRRSPFPSTRTGSVSSASNANTGHANYSIRAHNATASGRRSVPANTSRSRNSAYSRYVNDAAAAGSPSPVLEQENVPQLPHTPGYGGFVDYIPGVRQRTPRTEALAREINSLRALGQSESPRETEQSPRLVKRRNHSSYFRGADATGFHIPNPTPENLAGVMSLLPETPDFVINRDVLEKTLPSTFYSTRMKYNDSKCEAHLEMDSEDEDDQASPFGSSPGPADAASGETPSASAPIDNPRFRMPNVHINNSKHLEDTAPADKDATGDTSSTENSDASSSEEEDDIASKSKSEESEEDEDPEYTLQRNKKKHFEKQLLKEKLKKEKQNFATLKSKGDIGKVFGERATTPVRVAAMKSEMASSWTHIRAQKSEPGKNIAGTGFLRDLYKNSILGKDIEEIQRGLEALPTCKNGAPEHNPPFAPIPPFPEVKTQRRLIDSIPTSSLSPHRKLIEKNLSPMLAQKSNFAANQPLRNRNPKSVIATPSQSSIEIAEKVKALHDRVIDIIPPNHPNKKMLMGRKNLLSASPSNTRPRSRQHVPVLATKSGLTVATKSNDLDPMEDLFREHSRLSDAAAYSASKTRREVQTWKQKLGITPGLKLKPSLDTLTSMMEPTLERPTAMYLNAQLKHPRTTKSSKLARDQFQARDAQMIAARRQAILTKSSQQRSKYLLTDTELKQRVQENRPSRLFQPTQASLQRTEPTHATHVPKQHQRLLKEREDELRRSRFGATGNSFKPSPTIQLIPRRVVPTWRSI